MLVALFSTPLSPILAHLKRAAQNTPDRLLQPAQTPNPTSRNPCQHNAKLRNVAPLPMRVLIFASSMSWGERDIWKLQSKRAKVQCVSSEQKG